MYFLKLTILITLVTLSYVFYIYYIKIYNYELYYPNSQILSWIPIYKNIHLTSFYYDERFASFRFMGYSENGLHPKLSCSFYPSYSSCSVKYKTEHDLGKEFFFLLIPYPSDLSIPKFIIINQANISLRSVANTTNSNSKENTVLCITTMINYKSYNYFLQYIETYKFLGVNKFIIYKHNCSNEIQKIIDYYTKQNVIEVIEWYNSTDIIHKGLIHYTHGQHWKYNDCFYRYRNRANNILFTDLDEIVWPYKDNTINDLLINYDGFKSDVYFFQPELHIIEIFEEFDWYNHNISDFDMYSDNLDKAVCLVKPYTLDKYIVTNPEMIYSVFIHYPFDKNKMIKESYIPNDIGVLRHMRRAPTSMLQKCNKVEENLTKKDSLSRLITPKVNIIKRKLNF